MPDSFEKELQIWIPKAHHFAAIWRIPAVTEDDIFSRLLVSFWECYTEFDSSRGVLFSNYIYVKFYYTIFQLIREYRVAYRRKVTYCPIDFMADISIYKEDCMLKAQISEMRDSLSEDERYVFDEIFVNRSRACSIGIPRKRREKIISKIKNLGTKYLG